MIFARFLIITTLLIYMVDGYSQVNDLKFPDPIVTDTINQPYQMAPISFNNYFNLLKVDFAEQATSPFHLTRTDDLWKMGGFAIAIGVLFNYDESINHQVLSMDNNSKFIRTVSPQITKFGGVYEIYTIGAIGAYGYLFKDIRLRNATLLASQAYITSGVWANVIKFVTGRSRPTYFDIHTQEDESYWHGPFFQFKKNSAGKKPDGSEFTSFPSGHTTAAFSVATVYAQLYKDKPWVALVAYGSASLVGISRVTENKHWASDVLAGAALGYLCGTQVVRNFHRLEQRNVSGLQKKSNIDYNIGYASGAIMTQVTYTFR